MHLLYRLPAFQLLTLKGIIPNSWQLLHGLRREDARTELRLQGPGNMPAQHESRFVYLDQSTDFQLTSPSVEFYSNEVNRYSPI